LFSYLYDLDIDATNWRGEQAIRPAVVNRKVWGGNRSWREAASQGRIMSAIRTATQQGIDPIAFLVRLARAPDPATVPLRLNPLPLARSFTGQRSVAPRYPSTTQSY
jgi:transposase